MNKIIKIFLISILVSVNAYAGSDGKLELSKKTNLLKIVSKRLIEPRSLLIKV